MSIRNSFKSKTWAILGIITTLFALGIHQYVQKNHPNIVEAKDPPPSYTLTIENPINGTVANSPTGTIFVSGTVVTLTPTPDAGFEFDNWMVGTSHIFDDFSDGVAMDDGWTGVKGTWSVTAGGALTHSSSRNDKECKIVGLIDDGEIIFDYKSKDTSSDARYLSLKARYTDSTNQLNIVMAPEKMELVEYSPTLVVLDTNTNATTTQDTVYTVRIQLDGANVNVYRTPSGGTEEHVLSTTAATVLSGVDNRVTVNKRSDFEIDNVDFLAGSTAYFSTDDPLSITVDMDYIVKGNFTPSVPDLVAPVITLSGTTPVNVALGSSYTDAGATALDDVDGDITGNIVTVNPVDANTTGTYIVTYNVNDAAGNAATEVTRTVNVVEQTPPVITLTGSTPVTVAEGSSYTDAGATALDNVDGDITSNIVTVNPVDTNTPGTYIVTYNVNNAVGNAAIEVTRTVNVIETYTLTIEDPLNGTVMNNPTGTSFISGTVVTLTPTPDTDFGFNNWVVGDVHILDDFSDGVAMDDGWSAINGSWSVNAGGALTNTVGTGYTVCNIEGVVDDGEFIFDYKSTDTSDNTYILTIQPRFLDVNNNLGVVIFPNHIELREKISGTISYLDSNMSATTTQDTVYTVRIVFDGANVNVYRTPLGGTEEYVLSTNLATVLGGVENRFSIYPDANFEIDNIDILGGSNAFVSNTDPLALTMDMDYAVHGYFYDSRPVITLLGSTPVTVAEGSSYTDAGATALDNVDGDITSNIVTVNPVDTNTPGTYIVTYNVNDAQGNAAVEVTRTVNVIETYTLTIEDPLNGTVANNPTGTTFVTGTVVTLTPTPDTGFEFDHWVVGDRHILDDFSDGVAMNDGWSQEWGVWSVTNGALSNSVDAGYDGCSIAGVDDDGEFIFEYTSKDTSDNAYGMNIKARYLDADNNVAIRITPDKMRLSQEDLGVFTTLDTNTNATTIEDSVYTVRIVLDGANVKVYRTPSGGTEDLVLSTTSTTILSGTQNWIVVEPNADFEIDNIDILGGSNAFVSSTDPLALTMDMDYTVHGYFYDSRPVITLLGSTPVTVAQGGIYTDAGATALDDVDGDITGNIVTVDPVDTNTIGAYTVTYNVTDVNSNAAVEVTRTVNVTDQTDPVITVDGDNPYYVECGTAFTDPGVTITDNSGDDLSASLVLGGDTVDESTLGTYVITYDVNDAAGNSAIQVSRTVIVQDTTIPVITLLGSSPIDVAHGSAYIDAGATALDACEGDLTGSIVPANLVDTNTLGLYTVTYNVMDANSNAAVEVTRTVNVTDQSAPVITLTGSTPVTIECGDAYTELGATATDNIDATITVVEGGDTVLPSTVGSYVVTYNATDVAGNTAIQVTRTVNVVDTTIPVITLLGSTPIEVVLASTYTDAGASATDSCEGDLTSSIVTVNPVDTNTPGTYSVTYNVSDGSSNAAVEVTRTVVVLENYTLTLENPLNGTAANNPTGTIFSSGTVVTLTPTPDTGFEFDNWTVGDLHILDDFSDGVAMDDGWVHEWGAGWNATNGVLSNIVGTGYSGCSIAGVDDDGEFIFEYKSTDTSSEFYALVIKARRLDSDNEIAIRIAPDQIRLSQKDSGVFTTVDTNTNATTIEDSIYTIRIVLDGANVNVYRTPFGGIEELVVSTTSTTVLSGTKNWIVVEPNGSFEVDNIDILGGSNAYVSSTDPLALTMDMDYTVHGYFYDSRPVITLLGSTPVTVAQGGIYTDAGATALDDVDGDITGNIVTVDPVDTNIIGAYTVTYNVSDVAGNAAFEVTRTVNVTDQTDPVIAVEGNNPYYVECGTAFTDPGVTITDNSGDDLSASLVLGGDTVDESTLGTYVITYDVDDAAGNSAIQVSRTVIVQDTTIPVITLLGSSPIDVAHGSTYIDAGATALDACEGDLTASIVPSNLVDTNTLGLYTVTYNVMDANSNAAVEVTRTVNVTDQSAPVITLTGSTPVTIECGDAYTELGATATDNIDATVTVVEGGDTVLPSTVGTYVVTYNATDAVGNTATQVTRTVNVVDTTIPVITLLGSTPIEVVLAGTYTDAGASASDSCEGDLTSSIVTVNPVDTNTPGTYSVTYNVSDGSNNVAVEVTRTVIVLENYTLTLENPLNGTAANNPTGTIFSAGTVVTLTPTPDTAFDFTNWVVGTTHIEDDFSDGIAMNDGWTELFGLGDEWWTVTNGALANILRVGKKVVCSIEGVPDDGEIIFDYISRDTSHITKSLRIKTRHNISLAGVDIVISPNQMVLEEHGAAMDTNTNATTIQDMLYTVRIQLDGANVDVYRTPSGGTEQLVLTTSSATVLSGTETWIHVDANALYEIDNVDMLGGSNAYISAANPLLHTMDTNYTVHGNFFGSRPVITLLGGTPLTLECHDIYTDAGATAVDNLGADITGDIVTVNPVDTSTPGTYFVTYNVTDSESVTAFEMTRTVIVEDTGIPVITLNGSANITLECGDTFTDDGATALDDCEGDLTSSIAVGGDTVDTGSAGIYVITYDVDDAAGNSATQVTRTVTVNDTGIPVITLLGSTPIEVLYQSVYTDAGATALDGCEGDLTGSIVVGGDTVDTNTKGTYIVTFNVSDGSGNAAVEVTRTVTVTDQTPPVITLIGDDPLTVFYGDTYIDAGATALDNHDGDLTASIVTVNPVDTNTLGVYVVTYNVSDVADNAATEVTRTVNVIDATPPVITLIGADPLVLHVGDTFSDPGATATDNFDGDVSAYIVVGGDTVDTSLAGIYVVTYDVDDTSANIAIQVTRTVRVEATLSLDFPEIHGHIELAPDGVTPNQYTTNQDLTVLTPNITPEAFFDPGFVMEDWIIATVHVVDDFESGMGGWSTVSGDWEINSGVLTNTISPTTSTVAKMEAIVDDGEMTLDYNNQDTGSNTHGLQLTPRYSDANNYIEVGIYPDHMELVEYIAGSPTIPPLDSNSGATTVALTDYTVRVRLEGANINVYRTQSGEKEELVLSTTTATLLTAVDSRIGILPNASIHIDNVDFLGGSSTYIDLNNPATSITMDKDYILRTRFHDSRPVITLVGDNPYIVDVGSVYSDPGATAWDDVSGDISASVTDDSDSPGVVNTSIAGDYIVTFNVIGDSGHAAVPVTRTVSVPVVPEVSFAVASSTASEEDGTAIVTVNLSEPTIIPVTVPFTDAGTAIFGDDYLYSMGDLVFLPSEISKDITITLYDDSLDEVNETVVFTLGTPADATLGTLTGHTLNITSNNAPPTVSFTLPNTSVEEYVGRTNISIDLSAASGQTVTVPFTVTGTAESGTDFRIIDNSISIPAGATFGLISVTIYNDAIDENTETVVLTMGTPVNATLGATQVRTLNINDNDDPPIVDLGDEEEWPLGASSIPESYGTVYLPISLSEISCLGMSVPFTISGTATDGSDYTIETSSPLQFAPCEGGKFIEIPIIDDDVYETNETIIITLGTLENASIGSVSEYTLTIIDDDPAPLPTITSIEGVDIITTIPGGTTITETTDTITVTVTLTNPSSTAVTVTYNYYSSSGSGGSGGGSISSGSVSVTFAPGQMTQTFSINISDDELDEIIPEEIRFEEEREGEGGEGGEGGEPDVYIVTVVDNDPTPVLFFDRSASDEDEGVGTANPWVHLSAASAETVTVDYSLVPAGTTATGNGVDYTLVDGTFTFVPGETDKYVDITVIDDLLYEGDETVEVLLSNPVNAVFSTPIDHTLTIKDNEPRPTVAFSQPTSSVDEGVGSTQIDVVLAWASVETVTVDFIISGSSLYDTDYTLPMDTLVFAPGETTKTIDVTLFEDTMDEENETVTLTLSQITNGTTGSPNAHTLTILDNDPAPTVTFTEDISSADESANLHYIEATLSAPSGRVISIPIVVTGTADYGPDYHLPANPIIFNPGVVSNNVQIQIHEDLLDEDDETVVLTIDSPINATLGAIDTHEVTILDNDIGPTIEFLGSFSSVNENGGSTNLEVKLNASSEKTVTINYTATDVTTTGGGVDYTLANGVLTFLPGEVSKMISVAINNDTLVEGDETLDVTLSNPLNGVLGTPIVHTLSIIDNDFSLTTSVNDAARGSVTLNPPGGQYDAGTVVTLDVTINTGYAFSSWSGGVGGNNLPTTIVMDGNKSVQANFDFGGHLSSIVYGNGSISPAEGHFLSNTTVEIAATADLGWRFDHWENALTGNSNPGSLLITGNMILHAFFVEVCEIVIYDAIPGAGTVTQDPLPDPEDGLYVVGTVVTLTATPSSYEAFDYEFDYWVGLPTDQFPTGPAGPGTSSSNPISFNANKPEIVGPIWKRKNRLQTATVGNGSVAPGGGVFYSTQTVELRANAQVSQGWRFSHWDDINGDVGGTDNPTYWLMLYPTDAIAVFGPEIGCEIPASNVPESIGSAPVNVTMPDYGEVVSVPYTVSGTAVYGVDYTIDAVDASPLTFQPGETVKEITVNVINDTIFEQDETVVITLGTPIGGDSLPGLTSFHTLTIEDDDPLPIAEFDNATGTVDEAGYWITVPVSLSDASSEVVSVDYIASGGTALDGLDYECGLPSFIQWADNFDDLDISDWTGAASWISDFGILENIGSRSAITHAQTNNNFQMEFSYRSDVGTDAQIYLRESTNGDSLELSMDETLNNWEIYETIGGTRTLITTTSVTSTTGTWYDVYVRAVRGVVGIWRKESDTNDPMVQVFDLSVSSPVQYSDTFSVVAGTDFAINDMNVYTVIACQLVYQPGETTQDVNLYILDDVLDEADETIELTLINPINATIGTINIHTRTILDNDAAPTVSLTQATSSAPESVVNRSIEVALSVVSGQNVTVPYSISGTATDGTDFTLTASPLTIFEGETSATIDLTIIEDALNEVAETVVLTLGTPTNATLGAISVHTATIENDDLTIDFSAASSSIDEFTSTTSITLTLSDLAPEALSIPFTLSGTSEGADYTIVINPLVINAGESSKTIDVTLIDDALDEDDETLIITLDTALNVVLGTTSTHTLTILDDDLPPSVDLALATSIDDESIIERSIDVSLSSPSGKTVSIPYTLTGTAEETTDYTITASPLIFAPGETTKSIALTLVDDALNETDETVILTLDAPTNATLGTELVHTLTVTDDDDEPTVAFSVETSSDDESVAIRTIQLSLSAASGQEVTVPYSVLGSADGADFSIDVEDASPLTFAIGETTLILDLTVIEDALDEADETVVLSLDTPTNATLGATPIHTLTILNNDTSPSVTLSSGSSNPDEASGLQALTLTLSEASGQIVTVPYLVTGSATDGNDFTITLSPIVFAIGETSKVIDVTLLDDALDESDETLSITLDSPINVTLGAISSHLMTIGDNDETPTVAFTQGVSTPDESVGTQVLVINLSAASGQTVTVPFSVVGTASNGADFSIPASPLVFNEGETSKNIALNIVDDLLDELGETVEVHIGVPTHATVGGTPSHIATIIDNDATPTVSFNVANSNPDEFAGIVSINVTLSAASGLTVSVPYSMSGVALEGVDYSIGVNPLTFAAGETLKTIDIAIINDFVDEPDETLILTLTTPVNADLGAITGHVMLILDDDIPAPEMGISQISAPVAGSLHKAGAIVIVTFDITNSGLIDTDTTPWDSAVYLSRFASLAEGEAKLLALEAGPPINSGGGTATQNITVTIPDLSPGKYYIIVQSDANDVFPEIDESNDASVEFTLIDKVFTNE